MTEQPADADHRLHYPGVFPVVACGPGIVTVCTGRLRSGERVGLGFTSLASITAAYGPAHAQVRTHIHLLLDLLRPTGITTVLLDAVMRTRSPGQAAVPRP